MTVSTHVLDASLGTPAAGVSVALARLTSDPLTSDPLTGDPLTGDLLLQGRLPEDPQSGVWQDVESGVTDPDGRHRFGAATPGGVYRLVFGTGAYFIARGVAAFYPEVTITFTVAEPLGTASAGHFHVPLLLSPFSYSTYRGS
jgi:5-hydroxyisourate hydrolase